MKNYCLTVFFVLSGVISFGQSFMEHLKTSVERSEGGSGATVLYTVYLTPTNVKAYYAKDFDLGTLVETNGVVKYFELSKKVGNEEEILVINLETASQMELEISMVKGKYRFEFKFYY